MSGFASLHHPHDWSLSHVRSTSLRFVITSRVVCMTNQYGDRLAKNSKRLLMASQMRWTSVVRSVWIRRHHTSKVVSAARSATSISTQGRSFSKTCHMINQRWHRSHEGLMLDYEQALTRKLPVPSSVLLSDSRAESTAYYNTSAHFLWIGDRTRQLSGAHVEYFRGIRNPIGVKVGPSMKAEELVQLLNSKRDSLYMINNNPESVVVVNPDKESGRVTLITRYGSTKVGR
jgi:3-deoxy-7-phosphoheptulonate synthase